MLIPPRTQNSSARIANHLIDDLPRAPSKSTRTFNDTANLLRERLYILSGMKGMVLNPITKHAIHSQYLGGYNLHSPPYHHPKKPFYLLVFHPKDMHDHLNPRYPIHTTAKVPNQVNQFHQSYQ